MSTQLVLDLVEEDEDEESYVNEDCPEQCALEHDTDDHFQCEATGEWYAYCSDCGGHNHDSKWDDRTTLWNGRMVCQSCIHEYYCCDSCGEYYRETMETRSGDYYCIDCYDEYGSGQSQGRVSGEAVTTCGTCNTGNVHLDELTEEWLCQHMALERRARKVPVLV